MGRFLFNESVPVAVGWGPQGQHTNYSNTLLNSFGSPVVPAFAWGMGMRTTCITRNCSHLIEVLERHFREWAV